MGDLDLAGANVRNLAPISQPAAGGLALTTGATHHRNKHNCQA